MTHPVDRYLGLPRDQAWKEPLDFALYKRLAVPSLLLVNGADRLALLAKASFLDMCLADGGLGLGLQQVPPSCLKVLTLCS